MISLQKAGALLSLVVLPALLLSQKGIVRGQVLDGETGEPLYSANAVLQGTTIGTTTDFDGKYELSAEEGTYNMELTFIGMGTISISDVVVKTGEVTIVEAVALSPASNELGEVTITAEAARNTAAALMTLKKKSTNVIDGVSAGELKKTGDSDAGDAARRVTGVSVEGGKYVYVRGIGDRYTKTMLNGIDIPGLDPDHNTVQMDIFPTHLMDNMTILKSGLAELPADFTGGLVDIVIKDFPDRPMLDVSLGLSYNPAMHFNTKYLTYEGGKTDWLAFDDGTRALPAGADGEPVPSPAAPGFSHQEVNNFVNSFNPTLGAIRQQNFMDFDMGLSAGNQKMLENGHKLGYIFSLTYKNATTYYDDVEYGEYVRPAADDVYELEYTNLKKGQQGENNVLLGGMAGMTYKTNRSKYKLMAIHLQNAETVAAQLSLSNSNSAGQSGYEGFSDNLAYTQRSLTNVLLSGEHRTAGDKWTIDWKLSPTLSKIKEPDLRKTPFTIASDGSYQFQAGQAGNPRRSWRYLDEINAVGQVNFTKKNYLFGKNAELKFGGSYVYKNRNYEILTFDLQRWNYWPEYSGDPNEVLDPAHVYPNGGGIYYQAGQGSPNSNAYSSTSGNTGLYISQETRVFNRLKIVAGLRAEHFVQYHTGRNQQETKIFDQEKVLDAFDFFPSANVIFAVDENENLRFAYYRSIARPSFKELSFAQIQDPITDRFFNGGLNAYPGEWAGNLEETRINNFDLRWEVFMKPGEVFSVSGFAKLFDNAIELVRVQSAQTTSEFQPRNVGRGQLFGAEVEYRKSLDFISPAFQKVAFSGNFTYAYSQIQMTEQEKASRERYAKEGQTIKNTRAMAGQAPYILNAGFAYDDSEKGFNAGVFYNVKGRTLELVGGGLFPDVHTEKFHSLNLTARKGFGEKNRSAVSIKVSNMLNDIQESLYVGYKAQDQIFSRLRPGVAFSIGYTYKFF